MNWRASATASGVPCRSPVTARLTGHCARGRGAGRQVGARSAPPAAPGPGRPAPSPRRPRATAPRADPPAIGRPLIRLAGVRLIGKGDELLAQPERFERMSAQALVRFGAAIDQEPLGRKADPDQRRVAQQLPRQALDPTASSASWISMSRPTSVPVTMPTGLRPLRPDGQLVLGGRARAVPSPAGIVAPHAVQMAPSLLVPGMIGRTG